MPPDVFLQMTVRSSLSLVRLALLLVPSSWLFCESGSRSTSYPPGAWPVLGTKTSQTQMCLAHCPETSVSLCTSVQKTSLDLIPVRGWCFPEVHSCATAIFFPFPFALPTLPACIIHDLPPALLGGKCAPGNTVGIVFLSFTILSQIMAL